MGNLEKRLASLYRVLCPSSQTLGEYHLALLPLEEMEQVQAHLSICPHCRREVENLQTFLLTEEETSARPAPWTSRVKVLLAELLTSSSSQPAWGLAGVRGSEEDDVLLYQAEEWQVALTVLPDSAAQKTLLGTVFGPAVTNWQVFLESEHERVGATAVDETSSFEFSHLETGDYALILQSDQTEINILSLTI